MQAIHSNIEQWYQKHGRKALPWRNVADPYPIYLSEMMLQQTQVATVLDRYYLPFLERFPSLAHVASASLDDVLKSWEGLGYYRRARYIYQTAQQCGGKLPDTVEGLMALPGIGRNTAHAVMCFAHGAALPIMEANVRRIVSRYFALETASDAVLWEYAARLLNRRDSFTHNQALMDIGSLLCTPKSPDCTSCPLMPGCLGRHNPERYPTKKAKKTVPVRKRSIVVWYDGDRYFIKQRMGEFLHGLYGFCEYETLPESIAQDDLIGMVIQRYSHFELQADVYRKRVVSELSDPPSLCYGETSGCWVGYEDFSRFALSKADLKVVRLIG